MIRAAVRELRAHAVRVALTVLTISFGVAFVVGSWVVGDSVQRARTGVDLRTDFDTLVYGEQGADLGDRELATVSAVPGVARALPVLRGGAAAVIARGGKVIGSGEWGAISWDGRDNVRLTGGRAPRGTAEVALNERTAGEAGLAVGDRAGVLLDRGARREVTVVGLFAYRPMGVDIAPRLAFDPSSVRELFGSAYSSIEVTAAAGVDHRRLVEGLAAALPGTSAVTRADIAADVEAAAAAEAVQVRAFLLGFAALTLLVGSFLIVNTFAVLATTRIRQYALLRAVGASPRQIRRAVLAEAVVLAVLGSSVGVLLGVGLSYAGVHLLRPPGEIIRFTVSPLAVLVGYAVGLVATVAAGYGSARRSASVAPVVALRAERRELGRALRPRRRAGAVLLAGGVVAVLATAGVPAAQPLAMLGAGGAVAMLLGVLLLTPVFLAGVLGPLARLAARAGAPAARLALRNAARDPRRSAATASALLIGVALVSAVATVGSTMVDALTGEMRAAVAPSTTVVQAGGGGDFLGPDAMAAARGVPGRGAVVGLREGQALVRADGVDHAVWFSAVDPAGIGTVVRPAMVRGRADVAGGVVLDLKTAEVLGVDVGEVLALRLGESDRAFDVRVPVTGVYRDGGAVHGMLIAESLVAAAVPERYRTIYIGPAAGTTAAALQSAAHRAFAGQPDAVVTDVDGLIGELTAGTEIDLALLYGLLGAVIVVAIAGVVNTLVLSVLQRTTEIGVLRAVGASRRLVRRVVRCEALLLCCAGGVLAVLVGLPLGAVFQHLLLDRALWRFTVPWPMVAALLGGMVLVGVLAAAWPARRAARTDPLAAIAAGS